MKLATRDKNLLVFVIVCAIIFCSYNFGYKKLNEDKATLEKDIKTLETKINVKNEQYKKKDFYLIMKEIYGDKFNEELAKFPEDIQEENQIMFFKEIEAFLTSEENEFTIPSVSFSEGKTLVKFQETQKITGQLYEGVSSTVSFPFSLTYDKFKALLTYLENYEDRNVVSTVSASYSEDVNLVNGSVVFTQYAITEETRILLQPEVEDLLLGTDNLFTSPEDLTLPEDGAKEWAVDVLAKRIQSSFDMFVLLEPAIAEEFSAINMGFSKNSSSLLRDDKNEQQLITITVNELPVPDYSKPILDENGYHKMDDKGNFLYEDLVKAVIDETTGLQAINPETAEPVWETVYEYRVDYSIGEGDNAKKIEKVLIQPGEYLDLYVYCSDRTYAEQNEKGTLDKSSVKATVINNTTKYDVLNIYVVENNYMTEEEKEALKKEEELRKQEGKPEREDLTVQRWVIDEEKSTMDKINVVTTTIVEEYLSNPENFSSEAASSAAVATPSEEVVEESVEE